MPTLAICVAYTAYSGQVPGLADQYMNLTTDNLNLTGYGPNQLLDGGSGEDAIQVTSGNNVLDDRAATGDIWDTLVNFHAGEAATLFGVT